MYSYLQLTFVSLLVHCCILCYSPEAVTINEDNVSNKSVKCVPLSECFFYHQYVGENVLTSLKTIIQRDIIKQACGFNADGEVEKGKWK